MAEEQTGSMRMSISYGRWAGAVQEELYRAARSHRLEFEVITSDVGWFYNTVVFRVKGSVPNLKAYNKAVEKWIGENE